MQIQDTTTKQFEKSSYLTTFSSHYGRYRFTRPPLGVVPAGDMFQQKIEEIFKDLLILFGIADDILIVGYYADSRDHDRNLRQVMQISHQEN